MSEIRHKSAPIIETKTVGEEGQFEALVAAWDNVDLVGDRMKKGAFEKTLERWRESGDPIPVVLSHQWDDPFALVGKADPRAVMETERGLLVQGKLDLSNPTGAQVHKLMKDRLLKAFSFGYSVPKGGQKKAKDGANDVSEVDLIEVGPTLKGANPEAQLQAVKSALTPDQLRALATDLGQKSSVDEPADEPPGEVEDRTVEDLKARRPRQDLRSQLNREMLEAALDYSGGNE